MNKAHLMSHPFFAGIMFSIESAIHDADRAASAAGVELKDSHIKSALSKVRTMLSIADLHNDRADRDYWHSRTPIERLRAVQMFREVAYGRANASARLQRVLEVAERG